jgi:hypothetical protein
MTPKESKQALKATSARFINSVESDINAARYPRNPEQYREFYLDHLKKTDGALYEYLRNTRMKRGDQQVLGDVDHIIPEAVWTLLTGLAPHYVCVVSNLWIRDAHVNRGYDNQMISLVKKEKSFTAETKAKWIGLFVELKQRDIEGHPWIPIPFSQLHKWEKEQLVTDR